MNRTEIIQDTLHKAGVPGADNLAELITEALKEEDVCGLCGGPDPDKIPHPEHWPGEQIPDTELVHTDCEQRECTRAHACLTENQRNAVIRNISRY
jgi:hypothetical protein